MKMLVKKQRDWFVRIQIHLDRVTFLTGLCFHPNYLLIESRVDNKNDIKKLKSAIIEAHNN
jgi:hypothetical protein